MILITSKSVYTAFSPLFWYLDKVRPKNEESNFENFHNCYVRKCDEKKPPGEYEKRSVAEGWGSILTIGSVLPFAYGYFKKSNFWKRLSYILCGGGILAVITGVIKNWGIDFTTKDGVKVKKENKLEEASSAESPDLNGVETAPQGNSQSTALIRTGGLSETTNSTGDIGVPAPWYEQLVGIPSGLVRKLIEDDPLDDDLAKQIRGYAKTFAQVASFFNIETAVISHCVNVLDGYQNVRAHAREHLGTFDAGYTGHQPHNNDLLRKKYADLLGVRGDEDFEDVIKRAYKKKALEYHPDKVEIPASDSADDKKAYEERLKVAVGKFKEIAEAFDFFDKENDAKKETS